MPKGEIWFSYNHTVKEGEFDIHKVKNKRVMEGDTTLTVSCEPDFHGENSLAHRLFGWAVAMTLSREGDVDINLNPNQQIKLPKGYKVK